MGKFSKLETSSENQFVDWVKDEGFEAIKLYRRGWPDRLVVLVHGYCFYIEFKRDNKKFGKRKGEKLQNHIHKKLRDRGFHVYLVDSSHEAKAIFEYELENARKYKPFPEYRQ